MSIDNLGIIKKGNKKTVMIAAVLIAGAIVGLLFISLMIKNQNCGIVENKLLKVYKSQHLLKTYDWYEKSPNRCKEGYFAIFAPRTKLTDKLEMYRTLSYNALFYKKEPLSVEFANKGLTTYGLMTSSEKEMLASKLYSKDLDKLSKGKYLEGDYEN